jgi:hypothetical protein
MLTWKKIPKYSGLYAAEGADGPLPGMKGAGQLLRRVYRRAGGLRADRWGPLTSASPSRAMVPRWMRDQGPSECPISFSTAQTATPAR